MRHVLSTENAQVLAQLAWSKVLLAFDFDGTLSPIVDERDHAAMRPRTATLLADLSRRYPCAVISGRAQADVASRLKGTSIKYVIGNHGLEPSVGLEKFEREVKRARALLGESSLRSIGVDIEDKRYSLALHYRRSRHRRSARAAIESAASSLPVRMRVVPGKLVVNLVPRGAPNKGDALLELRRLERAVTMLYVGDDITDEDVFEIDQPGRLLAVRVGASRNSAAGYFLRDQREIDKMLSRLIALRPDRSTQ